MKSIAILIPTLKKGGAEKQAVLLAKALDAVANVTLIVPFCTDGFESELVKLSELSNDNIVKLDGNRQIQLYKILRERNVDTLFCYLTWSDFWGPIIGRLAGVRVIYQGLRNAELPLMKLLFERVGNIFSTGAITNNYTGAEIFRKKGMRNQTVIPNCYLNPMHTIHREAKEYVTVITVGRFVEQKDYPTAIAAVATAMAKNNKLRFKIIGHGELESDVRRLVKKYGIENRTEILINPPFIINHLMAADIYLSTSLFEGTSNSIMEAMDVSLPIIATDVGDNRYLVYDSVNGFLIKTKQHQKIAELIVGLAESLETRNLFGQESNRILKECFSFHKFKQSYYNLLKL